MNEANPGVTPSVTNVSNDSKSRLYRTSDIYFSAFLESVGVPLVTTEVGKSADGGRKVVFLFSLSESDLIRLRSLFFGGTGTVKARLFVDNLKSLKQMCFCIFMVSLIPSVMLFY